MADAFLGPYDEPQNSGAIVAVNYGGYRTVEYWMRSGANAGNWSCLGGEWGQPKVWIDTRNPLEQLAHRGPAPGPGPGEIPQYPHWEDVLARGPVTLLVPGEQDAYRAGWKAGRRQMVEEMEAISYDEPEVPGGHE